MYRRNTDLEALLLPLETVVIELQGPTKLTIVSCYFNPGSELPNRALVSGLTLLTSLNSPFLICGDFNSPCLSMGCCSASPRGKLLDDFLSQNSDAAQLVSDFEATFIRGFQSQHFFKDCLWTGGVPGIFLVFVYFPSQAVASTTRLLGPPHSQLLAL